MNMRDSDQNHTPNPQNEMLVPTVGQTSGDELDIRRFLDVFFRRRWIMLGTIIVALILGAAYTVTRKPIYESTSRMVVSTSSGSRGSEELGILSDLQGLTRSRSVETQVEIINSEDLLDEAFKQLDSQVKRQGFGSSRPPAWAYLVLAKKRSEVISVTGRAYTPEAAAAFANQIVETYMDRDKNSSSEATKEARKYVETELANVQTQLSEALSALSDYKKKTMLLATDVPGAQMAQSVQNYAQMNMDHEKALADEQAMRAQSEELRLKLSTEGQQILQSVSVESNPRYQAALAKLDDLHTLRAAKAEDLAPGATEIKAIDEQIRVTQERLRETLKSITGVEVRIRNPLMDQYLGALTSASAARVKAAVLGEFLAKHEQDISGLPEKERGLALLTQKVAVLGSTYQMLSAKNYNLRVEENSTLPNALVVSVARVPVGASFPNKHKNALLFFALGIIAAIAVALVADHLDTKIRDESTIAQITGAVALSAIPELDAEDREKMQIGPGLQNSAFLESFRILRNNISFANMDKEIKIMAVTSAGRSEGKSTTSVNLATAMAMDGKRVIIVDCDLRRPSIHKWMKMSRDIGLTNVVKGVTKLEDAIFHVETANIDCLLSGPLPPNPTEFLNSKNCREIIRRLGEMYDFIVLDCPPCAGISDMQVVSTMCDGVLLVVTMNQTLRPNLYMTMHTLRQVDAPVIGYVINRLDINQRRYGYYYSYYYYYYDYSQDDGKQTKSRGRRKR